MSSAPVSVGLVGCGRLAEAGYVPALAAAPSVRVVAVADPDPGRRAHLASRLGGLPAHPDAAALLAGTAVDALVLASPAAAHLGDAALAASRAVPVLVEKPPAPDAEGAAALAALRPPPWVGFNRRFDPGAGAVRAEISGRQDLELDLTIRYRRSGWAAHTVRDDALLDLGPHLVDWARWLTGAEVSQVVAAAVEPGRAALDLALGPVRARLRAAVDRPHLERIEVRAGGRCVARHQLGGLRASLRARLTGTAGPRGMVASLAGQLEALAAAVRGEAAPDLGTAADGHATMAVLDAARTCAASGRPTPVSQVAEQS